MKFKTTILKALLAGVMIAASPAVSFADTVEIRTSAGATWRGDISDTVEVKWVQKGVEQTLVGTLLRAEKSYIVVRGAVAGKTSDMTIFRSDISQLKSVDASAVAPDSKPAQGSAPKTDTTGAAAKPATTEAVKTISTVKETSTGSGEYLKPEKPGVFCLPLEGMVGLEFRHEEIEAVGKEADKYGPGQIIVLRIKSGGGMVTEMDKIHDELLRLRERHRVVAWIEEAISAACYTALHCDEIYFKTNGAAGSMTMFAGQTAISGAELVAFLERIAEVARVGNRHPYVVQAMVTAPLICTYDKDPETGEVTFYNTKEGQYMLSDEKNNLTLNSSNAYHCGFADGIADTETELANLLGLNEWYEIDNGVARRIHERWMTTVESAQKAIPDAFSRYQIAMASASEPEVKLGTLISVLKELIGWWKRAPNVAMMNLPPAEQLERQLADAQKQLADIKKARRNATRDRD